MDYSAGPHKVANSTVRVPGGSPPSHDRRPVTFHGYTVPAIILKCTNLYSLWRPSKTPTGQIPRSLSPW